MQSPHAQFAPDFAPDGRRIAFASDRSGYFEIYTADRDGAHPIQLTSFGNGDAGSPRWSPDGKRIAFDAHQAGRTQVFVVDAEGGTRRRLSSGAGDAMMPDWSPDGASIYYTLRESNGSSDIWKMPATGGESVRVTKLNAYGGIVSADGSTLYVGNLERPAVYAVPLALDGIKRWLAVARTGIYFATTSAGDPAIRQLRLAVSRDGTELLVALHDGDMSEVMLVENFR